MISHLAKAFNEINRQELNHQISTFLSIWIDQILCTDRGVILAYWPTLPEEPDFQPLLKNLMKRGFQVGLPRLDWQSHSLKFYLVSDPDSQMEADRKGLIQPLKSLQRVLITNVSAMIVPGLAFDRSGNRLGRGAGFYDRTIADLSPEVPRWAPAYLQQVVDEIPVNHFDKPVHGLITPDGLIPAVSTI